jgi:hypothetical protein
MKAVAAAVIAISLLPLGGCESQASKDARRDSEFQAKLAVITQFRDLNDANHTAIVEGARLQFGDRAATTLKMCYSDGYDTVQSDDHSFRNAANLGPKYVAQCDKIAHAVKESTAKWTIQHAKETSR